MALIEFTDKDVKKKLMEFQKTKKCPECGKTLTLNRIRGSYLYAHSLDLTYIVKQTIAGELCDHCEIYDDEGMLWDKKTRTWVSPKGERK